MTSAQVGQTGMDMDPERLKRITEAADWLVRLAAPDVSERDLAEWLQWCGKAENNHEFRRMQSTWAAVDQLDTRALEALVSSPGLPAARNEDVPRTEAGRAARGSDMWFRLAAGLGAVTLALAGVWYARMDRPSVAGQVIAASPTANQSAVLPDGSQFVLAPRTTLSLSFDRNVRKLDLSRGEAYFEVKPDTSRPFVVQAGGVTVTAVGTAFDVRSEPAAIVVTVHEGVVSIINTDDGVVDSRGLRLGAGYQATFRPRARQADIALVDIERSRGWRDGKLQYIDEPLRVVVADVSRYSALQVTIGDPSIAELAFTGTCLLYTSPSPRD